MPGLKWATYSFTPDIPPMTPWGKQRYLAVKPSYGPRSFADSTDYVNPTTGKTSAAFLPACQAHPAVRAGDDSDSGRVLEYFEFDHHIRQIFTDGRQHPKDQELTWMGDSIRPVRGDTSSSTPSV